VPVIGGGAGDDIDVIPIEHVPEVPVAPHIGVGLQGLSRGDGRIEAGRIDVADGRDVHVRHRGEPAKMPAAHAADADVGHVDLVVGRDRLSAGATRECRGARRHAEPLQELPTPHGRRSVEVHRMHHLTIDIRSPV